MLLVTIESESAGIKPGTVNTYLYEGGCVPDL